MLFATLHRYHNFATAVRSVEVRALESYGAGSKLDRATTFLIEIESHCISFSLELRLGQHPGLA